MPENRKDTFINSLGLKGMVQNARLRPEGPGQIPWARNYDVGSPEELERGTTGNFGRLLGTTHTPESSQFEELTKGQQQLPLWQEGPATVAMHFGNSGPRTSSAALGQMIEDARKITGQNPVQDEERSSYGDAAAKSLGVKTDGVTWQGESPESTDWRVRHNRSTIREHRDDPGSKYTFEDIAPEELDKGFNTVMRARAEAKGKNGAVQVKPPTDNTIQRHLPPHQFLGMPAVQKTLF